MIATCRACGLILPLPAVPGEPGHQKYDRFALAAFLHLLEAHPEHVNAACQPMMGKVANYVASLAIQSTDPDFPSLLLAAREQIGSLLEGLSWSEATKRYCFTSLDPSARAGLISKSVEGGGENPR